MKRPTSRGSLALALLATLAVSARAIYAEEQPVASAERAKITIDTGSAQPLGQYLRAGFWAYTDDARIPVIALIDGCEKNSGKISYTVLGPQDPDNATEVSLWNIGGDRLIDRMAAAACQHAKGG